ncbi:hypothetical protein [Mesorhizobium sp. WSM2239]|uniref:Uncharacterized protein n=2 Tax=unclassified Mesorhizobium TaxID=325217 RepID=A0AAU8DFI2_9HYPH
MVKRILLTLASLITIWLALAAIFAMPNPSEIPALAGSAFVIAAIACVIIIVVAIVSIISMWSPDK